MDKEGLSPELEQLLRKVRVKEPPQELMADFAKGVNERIDRGAAGPGFGFPQAGVVLAVGLVLAGAVYFLVGRIPVQPALQPVRSSLIRPVVADVSAPALSAADLSIEEEAVLIEELDEGFLDEVIEAMGDEDLLDEIDFMDTLELAAPKPAL